MKFDIVKPSGITNQGKESLALLTSEVISAHPGCKEQAGNEDQIKEVCIQHLISPNALCFHCNSRSQQFAN